MIDIKTLDQNALDRLAIRQKLPFTLYADLGVAQPKDWLVHNLLGAGEASAFYGKPGDGKSVLVEDMALHMAAGCMWLGRAVKQGLVVYFALERKYLVERRAIAFRDHHGRENLPFAIVGGIWDFRDPKTAERAVTLIRQAEDATEHKVVLVVIDTVSRALCGGDENSSKDVGGLVNATAVLQATGAHCSWVHHMPHDGDRMRGHGALLGAMDTTVHVSNNGGTRTATAVKANDFEEGERVTFALESFPIATDAVGNVTTAPIVVPTEAQPAVIDNGPKLTPNQRTMYSILHDAGQGGLAVDEWNARARDAGLGVKRAPDLYDFRTALVAKNLVRAAGERRYAANN